MNVTRHTPLDFPTLLGMDCLHTLAFLHSTHISLGVTNMDFIVLRQITGQRECLPARLADMRPLPCMRANVLRQAAGLRERLAARIADVRLLPRMRPHMHSQVAGLGERLAARIADVWLLPRMGPHVLIQVAGLRKCLAARLAYMLPLPRMRPHVPSQVAGSRERKAARIADVRLLPCMALFSLLHSSLELSDVHIYMVEVTDDSRQAKRREILLHRGRLWEVVIELDRADDVQDVVEVEGKRCLRGVRTCDLPRDRVLQLRFDLHRAVVPHVPHALPLLAVVLLAVVLLGPLRAAAVVLLRPLRAARRQHLSLAGVPLSRGCRAVAVDYGRAGGCWLLRVWGGVKCCCVSSCRGGWAVLSPCSSFDRSMKKHIILWKKKVDEALEI